MLALRASRFFLWGLLALAAWPPDGRAFADVGVGDAVEEPALRDLDGKAITIFARGAAVTAVVFVRPGQERSEDTLKQLAAIERELTGKPVRFVAIVSGDVPADEVRAFVAGTGVRMPVAVDAGDAFYGRLGVRLHPVIGVFDARRRLTAYEPFRQINYAERITGRLRMALGELSEAEFARVEAPERATTRTDEGVARRHLNYARNLLRLERHEKALAECERSLAVADSAAARVLHGRILAALGRCPDALRAFDAALRLEPGNAEAEAGRAACAR